MKRLLLFLFVLTTGCLTQENISVSKPNILFILVDDLGWKDLGCFGSSFYETPNIDRLAGMGARFTQAYAAHPVCSPTRAAIMTGKHPTRLKITDWIPGQNPKGKKLVGPSDRHALPLGEITIAEALKKQGYKTFFAGKWHLGDQGFFPEDQGFDINKGGHHKGSPPGGYYAPYNNPKLEDGPEGEHLTDRLTDESLKFMAENRDHPFLLYLSYYTVHTPIQAHRSYHNKFINKKKTIKDSTVIKVKEQGGYTVQNQYNTHYASMVYALDQNIGRLIDQLEKQKLLDNTLIVFTSDNGGLTTLENQNRNAPTSVLPLRAGKGWIYEGGIRVPLIIKIPNNTEPKVIHAPVVSMDFYPTLLDYTNTPLLPEQHRDGSSLEPLLSGETDKVHTTLFWDFPHYHGSGWTPGRGMRKGPWKLLYFFEDDRYELYRLDQDPGEKTDLALLQKDKLHEMKKILHQRMEAMEAQVPEINSINVKK
jgi:arylsulfatase A-like enzyme